MPTVSSSLPPDANFLIKPFETSEWPLLSLPLGDLANVNFKSLSLRQATLSAHCPPPCPLLTP